MIRYSARHNTAQHHTSRHSTTLHRITRHETSPRITTGPGRSIGAFCSQSDLGMIRCSARHCTPHHFNRRHPTAYHGTPQHYMTPLSSLLHNTTGPGLSIGAFCSPSDLGMICCSAQHNTTHHVTRRRITTKKGPGQSIGAFRFSSDLDMIRSSSRHRTSPHNTLRHRSTFHDPSPCSTTRTGPGHSIGAFCSPSDLDMIRSSSPHSTSRHFTWLGWATQHEPMEEWREGPPAGESPVGSQLSSFHLVVGHLHSIEVLYQVVALIRALGFDDQN